MGEIAEAMLEGLLDEETGELIDGTAPGYPRRMSDRAHRFTVDRPKRGDDVRTQRCVFPGCGRRFKNTTHYRDFLYHYMAKHEPKATP